MSNREPTQMTPRRWIFLLAFAIVLHWLLTQSDALIAAARHILAVTMPLIQGMVATFILNLVMRPIENQLSRVRVGRKKSPLSAGLQRGLSLLATLLLAAGVVALVLILVIPDVVASVVDLSGRMPGLVSRTQANLVQMLADYPQLANLATALTLDSQGLIDWLIQWVSGHGAGWLSSTFSLVGVIFGGIVSALLSLIFAIYILLAKERLQRQLQHLLWAVFPARIAKSTEYFLGLLNHTFARFFTGQFVEALILGAIFIVVLTVFGFPYALLISVLITVSALIPLVGAYLAFMIGSFLILLINPWQALAFMILFLVIQQLENNLIYPRVVGSSIGLPAIWVLSAVVIGGGLFGVAGMIVFIPLTAAAYSLVRDFVRSKADKASTTI